MQASSARPNGTSAVCVLRHSWSRATNCRSSDVFTVSRVRGVLMLRRCHARKIMSTALRKYVDVTFVARYNGLNNTGDTDMTNEIKLDGINYQITKQINHPQVEGRQTLMLKRPDGKVKYTAVRYEDGSFSSVSKAPF